MDMSDTIAHKVKFALPEAFAEETDISTQTDAIACRNFDVDSVALLTLHLYISNHVAYGTRNTHNGLATISDLSTCVGLDVYFLTFSQKFYLIVCKIHPALPF